jgi:hypothetical protein
MPKQLKKMDLEKEVISLSANAHALNLVLMNILLRMTKDESLRKMIEDGFDEAANDAEQVAIAMGHNAHPGHTVEALHIIEEMREAVIGRSAPNLEGQ